MKWCQLQWNVNSSRRRWTLWLWAKTTETEPTNRLTTSSRTTHGSVSNCVIESHSSARVWYISYLWIIRMRCYCNAVLHSITDNLLQWLQSVQNATARLVTRTGRCEHITPVLCELHWLLVWRRVEFKIATLLFKALNGLAPAYLIDDCILVSDDTCRLCSAASLACTVPRTRSRLGDRSFAVADPRVWNILPAALRAVGDYNSSTHN